MAKNIHGEAFDEGTLIKLELYEDYLSRWLPVFIESARFNFINVYDFFCGPGHDSDLN